MCSLLAIVVVAADAYFSAQEGYLSRSPDYDGVGYMVPARSALLLLIAFHPRAGLANLLSSAPGWNAALAFHYLILGAGVWQSFTVRFWAVALLLIAVYWIVRRRAPVGLAVVATVMTALLPMVSAGVRSSSWEFFTGQANYYENFGLDDLRPDILAIALIVWSIAILAEHADSPSRSTFVASAFFVAAAVLVKPSTSPLLLLIWAAALGATWFWNRRRGGMLRMTSLAVGLAVLLLLPWATLGKGVLTVTHYLYAGAVTYRAAYGTQDALPDRLTYFLVRIPTDLGQVEIWAVVAAALILAIAIVRRRLGRPELMYALLAPVFFLAYSLPASRNSHLPEWISMPLWIFAWAGVARLAGTRWSVRLQSSTRGALTAVAAYALIVYALGAFALANWPANEQRSNAQLAAVTTSIAHELGGRISATDCFAFAPGPGWPAAIQFLLMDGGGKWPASTATDIDTSTPVSDYVESAKQCAAVIAYRDDITRVAQAFYAPIAYQPYLQAVADWVRTPRSGYTLDRTWSFSDLAPYGTHTLGQYQGVSLTVDLFLRGQGGT